MPTIIEVRPGEGGDDARTFAAELTRTLHAHLTRCGHPATETTDANRTTTLASSIPTATIEWIAGTHRVQRIPSGASARHTSTATIAVFDATQPTRKREPGLGGVRVDRYRGSGPGGQHRNKVATAIRLVHEETGIVITRESGRSQSANLADASRELQQRLTDRAQRATAADQQRARAAQIAPGREAKTFTHNQQRGEVVDHQTGRRWTLKRWSKGRL